MPSRGRNLTDSSCFGTLPTSQGSVMIKSELVQKIAEKNPHLYHRDIERIVNTVLDEIIDALKDGDRVELRGFGAFSAKARNARMGRNPRTGEAVEVVAKRVPFFKTGKELRHQLNEKRSLRRKTLPKRRDDARRHIQLDIVGVPIAIVVACALRWPTGSGSPFPLTPSTGFIPSPPSTCRCGRCSSAGIFIGIFAGWLVARRGNAKYRRATREGEDRADPHPAAT